MTTTDQTQPAWQSHKHAESTDSEVSFFDTSSASTVTDSWSGYFEGWEGQRDDYCPRIVDSSEGEVTVRAGHVSTPKLFDNDELLPAARPRRRHRSEGDATPKREQRPENKRRTINTKRFGIVPYSSPTPGEEAIAHLNESLKNSMSNTEDILSAMYSPNWDVASLQRWYQQSTKSPAELALFKIMFSLRYTPEEIIPSS